MITRRFEKTVEKYKDKVAIKGGRNMLTYAELNGTANQVAHTIISQFNAVDLEENQHTVGILFDHGVDSVTALLAVLKAGKIYVPLDSRFPEKRLAEMVQHFNIPMIVTNLQNMKLAEKLSASTEKEVAIINIENLPGSMPSKNLNIKVSGDAIAYILHTSGSGGKPKGVVQNCKNVLFFADSYIKALSISPEDRLTFLSSFSFDGTVEDIYPALLSGATLYPFNINEEGIEGIAKWLIEEKINVYHSVPTVFRYFISTLSGKEQFPHLRVICMGAETLRSHDVEMVGKFFPGTLLAHMYGQTESSVNTMKFLDTKKKNKRIMIGKPLEDIKLYLFNEEGEEVEKLEIGEIFVASDHIALGYWKDPIETSKRFLYYKELGRLYRTGDWGRIDFDGNIEFLGRNDRQVKIRGFRVELAEIESQLVRHPGIKEAVAICNSDKSGDEYVCAYIVPNNSVTIGKTPNNTDLREYLARVLPDYMIPTYFVYTEKIPLTPNGKVDRKNLPEPEIDIPNSYIPPRDEKEQKMTEIWAEVLRIKKDIIGIDSNFFELGGHSLKATLMAARIHNKFNVKLPLAAVFKTPTIRGLAKNIKCLTGDKYTSIEWIEEKEYYSLSSAQKRLFVLNLMEGEDAINYNLPRTFLIKGKPDKLYLQEVFKKLIKRHESLRTSFVMLENDPVQIVHPHVEFQITISASEKKKVKERINKFIKPFDLTRAPLLRAELVKIDVDKHILMVDMHHIIADATSMRILVNEFADLYSRKPLPPLNLQYKDFAEWQNHFLTLEFIKKQEEYWLTRLKGKIPVLELPTDYSRPLIRSTEGKISFFQLERKLVDKIRNLNLETETTLYMVLLAGYNIVLSKYSLQEEILVGTPITGRNHVDLQNIIGTFANMLAMRNFPKENKRFIDFLNEVKENALKAYENQDYQFEELVRKLDLEVDTGRNPLFDVVLNLVNAEAAEADENEKENRKSDNLSIEPYEFERNSSKYDLLLRVVERTNTAAMSIEYPTALFKPSTVENMMNHYIDILEQAVENRSIKLKDITISYDVQPVKTTAKEDDVEFNF